MNSEQHSTMGIERCLRYLRYFVLIFLLHGALSTAQGQEGAFPSAWLGKWEGTLEWYQGNKPSPQTVSMRLHILPTDTLNHYTWFIQYGDRDSRPYLLKPVDLNKGHWVVDERNGILLDQFWVGPKFTSAFKVYNSTIIDSYYLEKGRLVVEFYTFVHPPARSSGLGTDASPTAESFRVASYQKAILKKQK
jgi:hypothetical protein